MRELLSRQVSVESLVPVWLDGFEVKLDILRLDRLHREVSGNKWFKLKYHLSEAREKGVGTLLSFGGAWSNHIHALAAAGRHFGLQTVGVIRGERPESPSAMLHDAESWGMRLHYVSRSDYRHKQDAVFQDSLLEKLGLRPEETLIIPEGGSSSIGVKGCEEILATGDVDPAGYDEIWLACGTGATLAGVVRSTGAAALVRGIAVLKGGGFLVDDIRQHLPSGYDNWRLETDCHCDGYGRVTPELVDFIQAFELDTGVPLDHVYTGKLLFAVKNKLETGQIKAGSRILLIHTGGLQGRRGLKK